MTLVKTLATINLIIEAEQNMVGIENAGVIHQVNKHSVRIDVVTGPDRARASL